MSTAPYQQFSLHTGTALHPTGDEFVFAVAENRDLFAIKKSGTGSGTTEIHVLSAASGYQQFSLQTGTALHPTGDEFVFAVAENRDLFAIKKSGTGSGTTEIHVLSAASGYQQFSLQTGTALHPTGAEFVFAVAQNRDLFAFKRSGTGSGTTEIHVLSAASGYQQFSLQTGTALHPAGDEFVLAVAQNRDLFAIKKSATGSGTTEIHVLSAASGYQQFSLQTGTALHPTGDEFELAVAHDRHVFAIKKRGTDSGTTELHVLDPSMAKLEIIEVSRFQLLWNDGGSGGDHDGAFYRPLPPAGYYCLGDYGQGNYNPPAPGGSAIAVRALEDGVLANPTDYVQVWNDSGSGADMDGSFWNPVPPPGYRALGVVAQNGHHKPPLDAVMCVRQDLLVPGKCGNRIWIDAGTGADRDFGAWQVVSGDERAIDSNTFVGVASHSPPGASELFHALNSELTRFARPLPTSMDLLRTLRFKSSYRSINFEKNGAPLDYHSIAGYRWQHLQDMIRLPDANGKQYYMGTYSQNCAGDEGGLVFVGEVSGGGSGRVIWHDELNNNHLAGGFNHPGDLRRIGNIVVIAGQNWDGGSISGHPFEASFWESLGAEIGKSFADGMDQGNGGQAILFYDVSTPSRPVYIGKLSSYFVNGVQVGMGEIDEVTAARSGDYFYLSFNGARCRSRHFTPVSHWELIQQGSDGSPSPVRYSHQGRVVVGGAAWDGGATVNFDELRFTPGPTLNPGTRQIERGPVTSASVPAGSFPSGATFSLSTMPDGSGSVVVANVESDSRIEIWELGTD